MISIRRRLSIIAALCCAFLFHAPAGGAQVAPQPSMVPTPHPVYDWLYEQRLAGRIPTYTYEQRPMTRGTIEGHLHSLEKDSLALSRAERLLLRDFLNEFDMRRLIANRAFTKETLRGLPGSVRSIVRDRRDPALYAGYSSDSIVSGAAWWAIGSGQASYGEGTRSASAYTTSSAVRAFLNTRWGAGWHFEADDFWTGGDRELVVRHPRYGGELVLPHSTSAYQYETFGTFKARWVEVSMGRGAQSLGPAVTDPLVLRQGAPFLGTFRLVLGTPRFNVTYLHSQLYADPIDDTSLVYQGQHITRRVTPERHLAQQRINWMPNERMTFTAWQSVVYANRGLDLDYLNPVLPFEFMQDIGKGDADNLMIGGDAIFRPWRGTELFASYLVDDTQNSFGPFRKAETFGVQQRLLPGLRAALGYTAVDPWVYLHRMRLNAYENRNRFLGPDFGPNTEELSARLTAWLPLRTRVMAGVRRQKRGLDPVDSAGRPVMCTGSTLGCAYASADFRERFSYADVHRINRIEVEAYTEIIRGLPLTLSVRNDRVVQGTQLKSNYYMDFRYRFGY